jgi:HK97 family phage prohead protease
VKEGDIMGNTVKPMEKKIMPLIVTGTDDEQGIVETVFAVFGNVDGGGDVLHPGSFKRTFQQRMHKVRILDQHRTDSVMRALGVPVELRELSRAELPPAITDEFPEATGGAYAKIQFLMNTPEGKGAFERIKAGAVDEWSFGYDAMDKDYEQVNGARVRNLRAVKLYELGPVLWGMNEATVTVSAKSDIAGDVPPVAVKRVVPYQDIPLANRTRAWNAAAARRRVRDWAGYDPDDEDAMDWSRYRRAFMWYDQSEPTTLQSYKLPYADVMRGQLFAVPRGIFAVAGALQGARTPLDVPEADQERLQVLVSRWYSRMAEEFDDDALVAPWDKAMPVIMIEAVDVDDDSESKAFNLTAYCRELIHAFYSAYPDVLSDGRDGPRVIYYAQEVYDTFLVVEQAGNQDGNGLYRVDYQVTDDGVVFADRADWIPGHRPFVTLQPVGMQTSDKAGRMLSQRSAERVLAAIGTLQELLVEAGVLEALAEEEVDEQEEAAGPGPSQTSTPEQPDADSASPAAELLTQINMERADIDYALITSGGN